MITVESEWLTGPQVQRYFNVSSMAIWRWMRDQHLGFPSPTKIRSRNYWRLSDIRDFEKRVLAGALKGNAALHARNRADPRTDQKTDSFAFREGSV
jgi:predicted DNA-binding transcriptional regulator AlpA